MIADARRARAGGSQTRAMHTDLGTHRLKSGATARLVVILGPEPDGLGIAELLQHKGELWQWHIDEALAAELEGLATRWYVALLDGRAVSVVMTTEHAGVGFLGHVFTRPEHRRQGLCEALFAVLMPDFRARGGRRLLLGTGFDSPPYWIYWRHGFRPVVEGTGFMGYQAGEDFDAHWYAPAEAAVAPLAWRHLASAGPLFADAFGDGLQAFGLGAFGPFCTEWPLLHLLRETRRRDDTHAAVLETGAGAVVGTALIQPDRRWRAPVWMLDLVAHPAHVARLPELVAALPAPAGKTQAYLPAASGARLAALEACGFAVEATLRGQLADGSDVLVLARSS